MPAMNSCGHFLWRFFAFLVNYCYLCGCFNRITMNKRLTLALLAALTLLTACKEKKQTQDIIAPKVEAPKLSGPIRMQPYDNTRDVQWLGKLYKVQVIRTANDSLPMVKDETGQKFVDNRINVIVRRADGSVAINKSFTKAYFDRYLDAHYREMGILEGLVFDEVDGQRLEFAASVCLPQTDEYIPLEVKIDNFGNVSVERDSELDTTGNGEHDADNDDV